MKTIEEKRLALLDETANHFNSNNRSINEGTCIYSGSGCAIGRKIADKCLCESLDSYSFSVTGSGSGVDEYNNFIQLPKSLTELGQDFLISLQGFHDSQAYWNPDGLSSLGKAAYSVIKKKFCQ